MDKINFSNVPSVHNELKLARWYTLSCALICLMLISMISAYIMQWRAYQKALQSQKSQTVHRALAAERDQLIAQKKECEQQLYARSLIARQLLALQEALAQDTQLIECAIALNGSHTFTLTTPSRQRAQECVAILGKKQLFGTLTITSLKTVKSDDKSHVLVTLKGQSTQNPT